jgi:hypothetical protein
MNSNHSSRATPAITAYIYDVPNKPGSYGDEAWITAKTYGFASPAEVEAAQREQLNADYNYEDGGYC